MFLQVIGHHVSSLILDDSDQKSYLWVLATFIKFEIASKKKKKNQETWVQSLGWEDPLEQGMATLSSILAWKIPWTHMTEAT